MYNLCLYNAVKINCIPLLIFFFADNFELTGDNEITLKGFLDLHVMTAEDEEGGEGEIWDILNTMGYNKQLQLDQVIDAPEW